MRARWRAHRNDVHERRLPRVLQADKRQLHLLLEEETVVRRESRVREVGVRGPCAVAACLRSQLSTGSSHDWNHALAPAAAILSEGALARAGDSAFGMRDLGRAVSGQGRRWSHRSVFSVTAPHTLTLCSHCIVKWMRLYREGGERRDGHRGAQGHRDALGTGSAPPATYSGAASLTTGKAWWSTHQSRPGV